ncbi:MAG: Peptidase M15 [Candidatus Accumulibacter sp. BA-94]|uniref:YcbK family protein n=1 Tax=Accumulibacter sp. TaxID=2053492 RepID=UPI00044CC0FC|nr:DUF882 domain-containing protein [Accumulibacter sp.]EXI86480.1 MAG: Peptidase M15 [Candidatus Accumulibacter sp. BA-94]MBL8393114.1 DUF882 domain-containing protein [Accumulibacter sp.]HRD86829.1 DUF882 domain-containing protein [Accumulibacter sp.]
MSKLHHSRRRFLGHAAHLLAAGAVLPLTRPAMASMPNARLLAFEHTHTGERLSLVFSLGDHYLPESLRRLNLFLRDHYSGEVGNIDPQLFDLLYGIRQELSCETAFQVISGYRCPETNSRLRKGRGGGVAKRSLHMEGKAIDIRLAGVPLSDLRDAAMAQNGGGVGYYAGSDFVHVDTGRVRTW